MAQPGVIHLSDADFPHWQGWEKVEEGQAINAADGFCDVRALLDILDAADTNRDGSTTRQELAAFLRQDQNSAVRTKLRHMVVKQPTEWDDDETTIEARYGKLKSEGQPLHEPESWTAFVEHIKQIAFWSKSGVADRSVWHFHPLQFVRRMKQCEWMALNEFAETVPKYLFYYSSGNPRSAVTTNNQIYTTSKAVAKAKFINHYISLNKVIRKYFGENKKRCALFLAQVLLETAQWRNPGGNKRLMHEWGFGAYSAANPATQFYGAFYGRGIMQLTWAGNFRDYGNYRSFPEHSGAYIERLAGASARINQTSHHYSANPSDGGQLFLWFPRFDPDIVAEDSYNACDSGGFYWVSKLFSEGISINRVCDRIYSASNVGLINRLVNGGGNGYYERQAYSIFILNAVDDRQDSSQIVVVTPPAPKAAVNTEMSKTS